MRAEVREKINKIRIYTAIVTVHIYTITVANVYIYTIIEGLMRSKFKRYCVNFASLSILHIFKPTDVNAVTTKMIRALVFSLLYTICWYILASRYNKHALLGVVIINIFKLCYSAILNLR